MRRSTVLSLSLQLVFPALTYRKLAFLFSYLNYEDISSDEFIDDVELVTTLQNVSFVANAAAVS